MRQDTGSAGGPRLWAGSVLVAVQLLAMLGISAAQEADYIYADDFSTDKAIVDSYAHSEFLESLPDPWPGPGFLIYEYAGHPNRALAFYRGLWNDSDARVYYCFPLDVGRGLVTAGVLALDIAYSEELSLVRLWVSYDGSSWPLVDVFHEQGHYEFDLTPPTPCESIFVLLQAHLVQLDNLQVQLDFVTPVEQSTWSMIKELFRNGGPPN